MIVSIRNPHDHSIGQVPEEAFKSHWRHLGWERVPEDEAAVLSVVANVTDEPVSSLDSLSRDDLLTAAERAGVSVRKNAKKETIIEHLRKAAQNGEVGETNQTGETDQTSTGATDESQEG